jgi:hypothetical protein
MFRSFARWSAARRSTKHDASTGTWPIRAHHRRHTRVLGSPTSAIVSRPKTRRSEVGVTIPSFRITPLLAEVNSGSCPEVGLGGSTVLPNSGAAQTSAPPEPRIWCLASTIPGSESGYASLRASLNGGWRYGSPHGCSEQLVSSFTAACRSVTLGVNSQPSFFSGQILFWSGP